MTDCLEEKDQYDKFELRTELAAFFMEHHFNLKAGQLVTYPWVLVRHFLEKE